MSKTEQIRTRVNMADKAILDEICRVNPTEMNISDLIGEASKAIINHYKKYGKITFPLEVFPKIDPDTIEYQQRVMEERKRLAKERE